MATQHYYRTRVAARILTLFFVGAIVPVVLLAYLSQRAVSGQLAEQSEERLRQLADGAEQLVVERLAYVETWTRSLGRLRVDAGAGQASLPEAFAPGIIGIGIQVGPDLVASAGELGAVPELEADDRVRLSDGASLLKSVPSRWPPALYVASPHDEDIDRVLWSKLDPDSIWSSAMTLGADPSIDDLCVLSSSLAPFRCLLGPQSELPGQIPDERSGISGIVHFDGADDARVLAWRSIYLRAALGSPDWYVVVSETESEIYGPITSFTYNFAMALVVALGLVLLLSTQLVRRIMQPLAQLTEGTRQVTRHDLSARVEVTTDDEFGQLASAFNRMTLTLSRQFRQLEAAQAIDRAVIEEGDVTMAVEALIDGSTALLEARHAAVLVLDVDSAGLAILCHRQDGTGPLQATPIPVSPSSLAWIPDQEPGWVQAPTEAATVLGPAGLGVGNEHVYVVPLLVHGTMIGAAAFASDPLVEWDQDNVERVHRLVGRAAVALNEVKLRRELEEMSAETLRALANTIDAKSKWTAGHSERVTNLAVAIGIKLEFDGESLDTLRRGGLLHDIGKIAISLDILDFPGVLDADMRQRVESHPVVGAEILEPIRVFRPILPIVLHHHERWDGAGYPHGLSGEDIPLLARVLAVADVFDAMVTSRPYRDALPQRVVVQHIKEGAGSVFDPAMVAAFEAVIAGGWIHDPSTDRRAAEHV